MSKRKVFVIIVTLAVIIGIATAFSRSLPSRQAAPASDKLQVVTSFYPMYFFASRIGGDRAEVTNLVPAGSEPHDYEPTSQEIARIHDSHLFILNGDGFEAWGDKLRDQLTGSKVRVIVAGEGLANQTMNEEGEMVTDPHVWLDPVLAKQEIDTIARGFVAVDPANAAYYQTNADTLKREMDQLDMEFKQGLDNCSLRDFVTSHTAFGYLAARYGLHQVAISGISPDQEPSPKTLADISDIVRRQNIHVIFFESLVSPKLSETVARETGAETLVLDPLEGISDDDLRRGRDYFTVMRDNLNNLQTALQCR